MPKSYYAILGVTFDAGDAEIKSAYRQLAKQLHPDHYSGDSGPFRQLQEAYSVLGNRARRLDYDRRLRELRERASGRMAAPPTRWYGTPSSDAVWQQGPVAEASDLESISLMRSFHTYGPSFDEIFDRLWSNFTNLSRPKGERLRSLAVEVLLSPEEARTGGHARIYVPAQRACPTCRGYGLVGPYACSRCAGEGSLQGEFPITLTFPAGLPPDHNVLLPLDRFGIRNIYLDVQFRISHDPEHVGG
jgi:DnaJ-class molecular chaperone